MDETDAVRVVFLSYGKARRFGNNVAWSCSCDDELPLIASTLFADGKVECRCGRRFRLEFKEKGGPPLAVLEEE